MEPMLRVDPSYRQPSLVTGGIAFVLSSAVHAAVLLPLASMIWSPPAPQEDPQTVLEVTLAWAAPSVAADILPQAVTPPPPPPAQAVHRAQSPPASHLSPAPRHLAATPVAAPSPMPVETPASTAPSNAGAGAATDTPQLAALPMAGPPPIHAAPATDQVLANYARLFLAQLERHKTYPALSLRRGEEGTVTIRITVSADGTIIDAHPQGDGPSRLEAASLEAITAAAPFPPLPSELGASRVVFNLPVTYRLK